MINKYTYRLNTPVFNEYGHIIIIRYEYDYTFGQYLYDWQFDMQFDKDIQRLKNEISDEDWLKVQQIVFDIL